MTKFLNMAPRQGLFGVETELDPPVSIIEFTVPKRLSASGKVDRGEAFEKFEKRLKIVIHVLSDTGNVPSWSCQLGRRAWLAGERQTSPRRRHVSINSKPTRSEAPLRASVGRYR